MGVTAVHCQGMIRKFREWIENWIPNEGQKVLRRDDNGRLWHRELNTAELDEQLSDDPVDQLARAAEVDEEWKLQAEDTECEDDMDDEPTGLEALVTATLERVKENEEPQLLIPQHLQLHPLFTQISGIHPLFTQITGPTHTSKPR